jgi:PHD/YefM family antitoxin component YafN of YafNO toxin-antitoxin module
MLDVKQLELQYVTNDAGEKTAVILPIDRFRELMEEMEDLAAAAARRDEPTIPHKDLIAELKQDGLI